MHIGLKLPIFSRNNETSYRWTGVGYIPIPAQQEEAIWTIA
jgi:hypothetical protein